MTFKSAIIVLLSIATIILTGCTYHNEDEYFKDNPDICYTEERSFNEHILPILENNCIACHNSIDLTAGISLENHDLVLSTYESGRFLGAIRHEEGFTPMPLNQPKIPECEILQIEAWIEQGLKDN